MENREDLKRILKKPLDRLDEEISKRLGQFLAGIFDAGRAVGFKEGYAEAQKEKK